jgi:hypothetical protein
MLKPIADSAREDCRDEICPFFVELKDTIPMVIENLSEEQLEMEYPEVVPVTPPRQNFLFTCMDT